MANPPPVCYPKLEDGLTGPTQTVPIDAVSVRTRKRPLGDVSALAESIATVGLLNPITVTTEFTLVAGHHRLEACRKLGWERIPATIVPPDTDELHRELAEIDENLIRNELVVLERAEHLKRRKEIGEELGLYQTNGGDRRSEEAIRISERDSEKLSFVDDTAEKTRSSRASVARELQIANGLSEDAKSALRGTEFADSKTDLLALIKVPREEQAAVVAQAVSGEAKNLKAAASQHRRVQNRLAAVARGKDASTPPTIEVRHCSCLEMIASLADGSVSLLLTDPPYAVTDNDWDVFGSEEAYLAFMREWLTAMRPKMAHRFTAFVFCDATHLVNLHNLMVETGWPLQGYAIWHKPNLAKKRSGARTFMSAHEPFWHAGTRELFFPLEWGAERFDVQRFTNPQSTHVDDQAVHPTQKPRELFRRLVELGSLPGELVVDPFCGSGTTALATKLAGDRSCVTCDLSEEYVKIARGRLVEDDHAA